MYELRAEHIFLSVGDQTISTHNYHRSTTRAGALDVVCYFMFTAAGCSDLGDRDTYKTSPAALGGLPMHQHNHLINLITNLKQSNSARVPIY